VYKKSQEVTALLRAWGDGDAGAEEKLWSLVYGDLRAMAARLLKSEREDHTLQATALVHESFLRLVNHREIRWQDRAHFFALASRVMRHILVDHARRRDSAKRCGAGKRQLDDALVMAKRRSLDLVALDDALSSLESIEPQKATVVELRFFGGLTARETAEVLGCSEKTVLRHWSFAKIWLYHELNRSYQEVPA
jgi:RNA polymerase sigma factor (TIGR02999 family)